MSKPYMTKAEFVHKLRRETRSEVTESFMIDFVDCCEALGLIVFEDKEKDPLERLTDRLLERGWSISQRDAIMQAMLEANCMLISTK